MQILIVDPIDPAFCICVTDDSQTVLPLKSAKTDTKATTPDRKHRFPLIVMLCLLSFNVIAMVAAIAKYSQSLNFASIPPSNNPQRIAQCHSSSNYCVAPQLTNFP